MSAKRAPTDHRQAVFVCKLNELRLFSQSDSSAIFIPYSISISKLSDDILENHNVESSLKVESRLKRVEKMQGTCWQRYKADRKAGFYAKRQSLVLETIPLNWKENVLKTKRGNNTTVFFQVVIRAVSNVIDHRY